MLTRGAAERERSASPVKRARGADGVGSDGEEASSSAQSTPRSSPEKRGRRAAPADAGAGVTRAPEPRAEPRWITLRKQPVAAAAASVSTITAASAAASTNRFIQLPHPRTGEPARYLLQDDGRTLLEATELDAPKRSWFIGDHVYEDGRLLVLSPIHPIFVLLPLLERAKRKRAGDSGEGVFVQLDEVLSNEQGVPGLAALQYLTLLSELDLICDVKRVHDLVLYRLNDDRATQWLQDRVKMVAASLRGQSSLDVSQAADLDSTARSVLTEYLNDTWAARLATSAPTPASSRNTAAPVEDYGRPGAGAAAGKAGDKKAGKPTQAQKALSAVDTSGMKKMSSFFTKKPAA